MYLTDFEFSKGIDANTWLDGEIVSLLTRPKNYTDGSMSVGSDFCKFYTYVAVQDHYFDVVTNVVGLVAAILGDKFYWWIDPAGAILLAIYTIANWSGTVLENAGR